MNVRGWRWLAVLALAALGSGCASVGVEFEPEVDFTTYRTWDWLPRLEPPPTPYGERQDEVARVVEQRTEELLAERGYVRVDETELPDFWVTYHVELVLEVQYVQQEGAQQSLNSMSNATAYGSYQVGGSQLTRRVYERGHLVIDVADGDERQLVWRGQVGSKYRGSWTPHAPDAVEDILERFPPEAAPTPPAAEETSAAASSG